MSENDNFGNNIDGTLELLEGISTLEQQFARWMKIKAVDYTMLNPIPSNILNNIKQQITEPRQPDYSQSNFDRATFYRVT